MLSLDSIEVIMLLLPRSLNSILYILRPNLHFINCSINSFDLIFSSTSIKIIVLLLLRMSEVASMSSMGSIVVRAHASRVESLRFVPDSMP